MYEHLINLSTELKKVKTYLVKIGPGRRQGEIVLKKLKEADNIVSQFNCSLEELKALRPKLKEDESLKFNEHISQFYTLYDSILDLCSNSSVEKYTSKAENMAKFDLKVALNLLPVLKDDETSTKQLIDGIEYYQSELDQEGQSKLVNFVLKSRLSQAAKLKLDNKYESVDGLIKAMKTHLLPKKSATALQHKLFNMRQNDLSIDDYGKQITDLFVDLTISQSDGNETSFNVLKPINEKQAIKSFAEGLRNRRLSTIIAARNYSSLSYAVQAAIDEQITSPSTSGDILAMRYNNRNNFYQNRNSRGQFRSRGQYPPGRGQVPDQGIQPQADESSGIGGQFRGQGAPRSSRGNRGKIFYSRSRNAEGDEQEMHILTDSGSQENKESKEPEHDKFFRE